MCLSDINFFQICISGQLKNELECLTSQGKYMRPANAEMSMCMCAVHRASTYQIICVH